MKQAVIGKQVWQGSRAEGAAKIRKLKRLAPADLLLYAAAVIVLFIISCALFPSLIAPYSPTLMNTDQIMQPPSLQHVFGTDYFGRDVFSVVVHGSRDSLLIGFVSVLVGCVTGGAIGAVAGYIGGVVDAVFMRLIDVLMTIPGVLLALAIAAALGPSLMNVVLAVAAASIPGYARVMRGQIMSIKGRPFITASRSIGTSSLSIFVRHVLPNSLSPMFVMAAIGIGTAILTGAGLNFLGLGTIKEIPDWGALLSQGRGYLTVAWWICTFPGLAITLFVLSINILGDKVRDQLDPKQSRA
ncbi:peptide/nickel transport system permease protein [Paenibacillus algorifonticola]|uniref:Peptide/nickel transport system permease protein n=1 Tax=Paenibacillus algorifonticola TaxID=684063 RepID=A0A1I2IBK9_9BACL|nr:ABC transporter permease [Paenibacillus algorifonticola]SFF38226.1 peptide/nickel transport system permease protein [Paenibacillus algorifonticola]